MSDNLAPDEELLVNTELHWIMFFWPVVISLCLVYFMFKQHILFAINYAAIALIAYFLGGAFIRYTTTYYNITTKRVMKKTGFLATQTWDMRINRIESVQLRQTLAGKLIGYGDIVVNGVGGDRILFALVDDPLLFQRQIFQLMDKK